MTRRNGYSHKIGQYGFAKQQIAQEENLKKKRVSDSVEEQIFPPLEVLKRLVQAGSDSLVSTLQLQVLAGSLSIPTKTIGTGSGKGSTPADEMSSDVWDNDIVLKPPMLLPKMLKAAAMRPPRKRCNGNASSVDSTQIDSCSRSSMATTAAPAAARDSLPPCKASRFSTMHSDAASAAASISMDAWMHARQQPRLQPHAAMAASPSASWTAGGSSVGSPIMLLAREECEDVVLMGSDDEGECLAACIGDLAFEERACLSGHNLGLWGGRRRAPKGVPAYPVMLTDEDEGAGTDGEAGGDVEQAEGMEVRDSNRRMQHVCSTVSERREEEEELAEEETETEMSGHEEGEQQQQHRRYLSCQSCSTGYSSADGAGAEPLPDGHLCTNGRASVMSCMHINTSARYNSDPAGTCSDPTPLPPLLSASPPGIESRPSGVSLSPTHSHGSSLCPLSPVQLASLPPSQPTSAKASTVAATAAAAEAVKQCSPYPLKPLPAAACNPACKEEEGGSKHQHQQQEQQGRAAGGAVDPPVSVCRVCRKLRLTGCPAKVRAWLQLQSQLHPPTHSSPEGTKGLSVHSSSKVGEQRGSAPSKALPSSQHSIWSPKEKQEAQPIQEQQQQQQQQQHDQEAEEEALGLELTHVATSIESVHRVLALWEDRIACTQQAAANVAAAAHAPPTTDAARSLGAGTGTGAALAARLCSCAGAASAAHFAEAGCMGGDRGTDVCVSHAVLDGVEAELSDVEEGKGGAASVMAWGGNKEGGQGQDGSWEDEEEHEGEHDHDAGSEGGADCPEAQGGREEAEGETRQQTGVQGRRKRGRNSRRGGKGLGKFLGAVGGGSCSNSPWAVVLALAVLPWARL